MDPWAPNTAERQTTADLHHKEVEEVQGMVALLTTFIQTSSTVLEVALPVDPVCQTLPQTVDLPTLVNSGGTHLVGPGHLDLLLFLTLGPHSLPLAHQEVPVDLREE